MLVDRAPEVMQRAVDPEEDLIQMPDVARLRPASAEPLGELRAELSAPAADALVRHRYAPLRQDELDVAQAQAEHVVQPDGVADDLGGKPVTGVGDGFWVSSTQLGQLQPFRPEPINLTMPAHVNHLIGDLLLHDQLDTSNNRL